MAFPGRGELFMYSSLCEEYNELNMIFSCCFSLFSNNSVYNVLTKIQKGIIVRPPHTVWFKVLFSLKIFRETVSVYIIYMYLSVLRIKL
jgi:hypothetical protein